ncbi:hypothetical protein GH714_026695 [Hevea brasiliensis]|uniref:Retrovirus-related Pol polyprotein from transposon TNT 1-94-like beta-barrel domain-containing protein n=1 Tax=Hevea brasiliensis TaxID=3981 RepID=A0A6A6NJC2_HEVBR|nr:hypothetical protein GH714_026695 [Hevea brasiliensis]
MVLQDTPLDEAEFSTLKKTDEWNKEISNVVKQEVMKYLKGKMTMEDNSHNFSCLAGFAGMADVNCFLGNDSSWTGEWIIDTSASTHMISNPTYFDSYQPFNPNTHVYLPDGSKQIVDKDQWTRELIAVGKMTGGLYRLNKSSFLDPKNPIPPAALVH